MATFPYFPIRYFPAETGVTDYPDVGNVLDTDTVNGSPGTYHEAGVAEVRYGVTFGPLSAYTGTYGQGAPGDAGSCEPLRQAIMTRFTTVTNDFYTDVSGRLFFVEAPEGTNLSDGPYAVFFIVSDNPDDMFSTDGKEAYIQFSLFSGASSPATILGMAAHLEALFKDQIFVVAGWTVQNTFLQQTNGPINVPADTEAGTGRYWQTDIDYLVVMEES
jgi:hypothetical protein